MRVYGCLKDQKLTDYSGLGTIHEPMQTRYLEEIWNYKKKKAKDPKDDPYRDYIVFNSIRSRGKVWAESEDDQNYRELRLKNILKEYKVTNLCWLFIHEHATERKH